MGAEVLGLYVTPRCPDLITEHYFIEAICGQTRDENGRARACREFYHLNTCAFYQEWSQKLEADTRREGADLLSLPQEVREY